MVKVPHKAAFITSLVSIVILEKRNEVWSFQGNWKLRVQAVPIPVFLRKTDVSLHHILVLEQLLEHIDQVIQICDHFILAIFSTSNVPIIKFKQSTLYAKRQGNNVFFTATSIDCLLELDLHIDVFSNEPFVLNFCALFSEIRLEVVAFCWVKLEYDCLSVWNC